MNTKKNHLRPDLIGEHSIGDIGQIIALCLFLSVWMIDSFFLKIGTTLNTHIPIFLRIPIATLFFILSIGMAISSINTIFIQKREEPKIIQTGLYAIVRHPMYLSEILLYFTFLSMSFSYFAFAIVILILVFFYFICTYEEKILINHFGAEYEAYMKKVPMWIPRLRKKRND